MPTTLSPYLNFRDQTKEAMDFYQSVLGGDLRSNTYAEFGLGDEIEADKVMHSQLTTPDGLVLMAADVPTGMDYSRGVNDASIALFGDDADSLGRIYRELSEGGTILQPLEKAPWGDSFGSFVDRFGVSWMVNILGAPGD
jgi:PhnB protein